MSKCGNSITHRGPKGIFGAESLYADIRCCRRKRSRVIIDQVQSMKQNDCSASQFVESLRSRVISVLWRISSTAVLLGTLGGWKLSCKTYLAKFDCGFEVNVLVQQPLIGRCHPQDVVPLISFGGIFTLNSPPKILLTEFQSCHHLSCRLSFVHKNHPSQPRFFWVRTLKIFLRPILIPLRRPDVQFLTLVFYWYFFLDRIFTIC